MPRTYEEERAYHTGANTPIQQAAMSQGSTAYDRATLQRMGAMEPRLTEAQQAYNRQAAAAYGLAQNQSAQQMAAGGRNPLAQRQAIMAGARMGEQGMAQAGQMQQAGQTRLGQQRLAAHEAELSSLEALQQAEAMRRERAYQADTNELANQLAEAQATWQMGKTISGAASGAASAGAGAAAYSDERLKTGILEAEDSEEDRLLKLLAQHIGGLANG